MQSGYLVKKAGIAFDEVDDCYLAGGFGTKIDITKAAGIGLIPKELEVKNDPGQEIQILAWDKGGFYHWHEFQKKELEKIPRPWQKSSIWQKKMILRSCISLTWIFK